MDLHPKTEGIIKRIVKQINNNFKDIENIFDSVNDIELKFSDHVNYLGEFVLNNGDRIEFDGTFKYDGEIELLSLYINNTTNVVDEVPFWINAEISLALKELNEISELTEEFNERMLEYEL
jgi:hypothetical protein